MTSKKFRDIEVFISEGNLKDILAAFLYQTTIVADNEDIVDLTLGLPNQQGTRPIRFKVQKQQEVDLIVHS